MNKKLNFINKTFKLIDKYVYIKGLHLPKMKEQVDNGKKILIKKDDYDNLLKFKVINEKN